MKALFAFVGLLALIFFVPLIGALLGAFTGWLVGIFWPKTFGMVLAHFGMSIFQPYQIGAALGFVGGFFKSNQTNNNG